MKEFFIKRWYLFGIVFGSVWWVVTFEAFVSRWPSPPEGASLYLWELLFVPMYIVGKLFIGSDVDWWVLYTILPPFNILLALALFWIIKRILTGPSESPDKKENE